MSTTPKEILFDEEARLKLNKGIKKLAEVVGFTLGPKGRNVGLEKSWGAPTITNDGNSIVKEVSLEDTYENMGVQMAKEVAQKLKDTCGDGTTTATLFTSALVDNGIKFIAAGASPISLKRGIDKAIEVMTQAIDKSAIAVKGDAEIRNIATVSASGNSEIGDLIAEAMAKVGKSGVITIEESKGTETTIELVEGMQFDRGYISPYFCTNAEKMIVEVENGQILITDKKINNVHEILPVLQTSASTGKFLLIIADDIEGYALSTLVVNRLRGSLKVAAVKAPGFGDRRKAMLQDIATLTGGTVISEEVGLSFENLPPEALGSAQKITITKDHTTIVGGAGTHDAIKARIKQIESEIKQADGYDKEKLEERKAKLSGGVAVIKVGAHSEPEMKQKKQVFEDSLSSTKAAVESGIVPGGGKALLNAANALSALHLTGDEAIGLKIVRQACEVPLRQIAFNSGFDGNVIVREVEKAAANIGFNALTGKIEDLLAAGVIDPAKVIKSILTYSSSAAGIILISEALIIDAPEEDEESEK